MAGGDYVYLDSVLVPMSLFFTIGYHAYLWHCLKTKPTATTIGIKRRAWLRELNLQGDEKKGMLAVQSLRNTLMFTILVATVTIIIIISLAALASNAFNANRLLLGSQSARMIVLKYGSASMFLVGSFLCSSMAVAYLVDANFLINTEEVAERGFALALVGNRLLCIAFPLLLWMLGPLPVAISSLALVWALYGLDFLPSAFSK